MTSSPQPCTVTLVLRRRAELPADAPAGHTAGHTAGWLTSEELGATYGAAPEDLLQVRRAAAAVALEVVSEHAPSRRVQLRGSRATLTAAFGETGEDLSAAWQPAVTAVLGLRPGPVARPQLRHPDPAQPAVSYPVPEVGAAYGVAQIAPAGATAGAGTTISIIELGGGYRTTDLATYFTGLGIPVPVISAIGVDGAVNAPGSAPGGADLEVALDIEVAGALAPGASLRVYFAPNTDQGFVDAISDAAHAHPAPTALSISWGGPEVGWGAAGRASLDAALADAAMLGVTVTAAAGDSGSTDGDPPGVQVDFPAASPHALACGGTRLEISGGVTASETVWNDGSGGGATGGGVSRVYPVPGWQAGLLVLPAATPLAGRGVPDVAADADPQTGYQVQVDGAATVVGGTSAAAPLWAAVAALLAQRAGRSLGLLAPMLYTGVAPGEVPSGFRDIVTGDNGAYLAGPGWDACTGLGSPIGPALATRLAP